MLSLLQTPFDPTNLLAEAEAGTFFGFSTGLGITNYLNALRGS
ncbi:hypothetical protein RSK20926_11899 [Roseobacter sp. SK209-2-6]|nr:hypothetical protein RSK20926_11899 [Roseobacter sp. SK209-2-6]